MLSFLPALAAVLSGVWCGTFFGGASWAGSTAAAVLPLILLATAGVEAGDPLRLGRAGRLLPAALWIASAASAWASPVPRAGRVALILLPAYLALPGTVARCWSREAGRRLGLRALSGAVGAVALLSFAGLLWLHTERTSLPLGHHNLLAAWLLILLPLSLLPAWETGRWRFLGWGSGLAGVAAVLASRSLLGIAALAIEVLAVVLFLIIPENRRDRGSAGKTGGLVLLLLVALVALVAGAVAGPRAWRILSGSDLSTAARAVYYRGGWEGFLARPILGWGPGSVPWTIARVLHPRPGVNPASEVVGELHSLPLQLAYELGITGLLLAVGLVVLFIFRRLTGRRAAPDRPLLAAGLLGLLGAVVASLGSASLAITALPLAAAVAAGATLAGEPPREPAGASGGGRWPARAYGAIALLLLSPILLASYHYGQAVHGSSPQATRDHLARAVALDPAFPLYRARLGWLLARSAAGPGADLARQAAEEASGVGPLWLAAGVLALGAGQPAAPPAQAEACALDPLSPFAPYFLAVAAPRSPDASSYAAHALLAEPRLLAATFWDRHPRLLAATLREVVSRPGIDRGWQDALLAAAGRLPSPAGPGERGWLALEIDQDPSRSLSLYAFRRPPWPLEWPLVEVHEALLAGLDLPSASALRSSSAAPFRCLPLAE
jgi:O-antigen ligase